MQEHQDLDTDVTTPQGSTVDSAPETDERGVDDLLEDVSIDGMCGVY